jgi:hypothetical protein
MMRKAYLAALLLVVGVVVLAQTPDNRSGVPIFSNPGGSPFPPGQEPSLTHTATVFWTTEGGMTTEVHIKAAGNRATQFSCWKMIDGKKENLRGSIAPDCDKNFVISKEKAVLPENVGGIVVDGQGGIEVRVFGFKREDFDKPPIVTVTYTKNGKVVGETKIVSHPLPDKFKNADAKPGSPTAASG